MRDSEARTIIGEWLQEALAPPDGWDLPVAGVERELRTLRDPVAWATSPDQRVLWVLCVDDSLRKVVITEDGLVESTLVQLLAGEEIRVTHTDLGAKPYQDTETRHEIRWTFNSANGEELVQLIGTVRRNRTTGQRTHIDRRQQLAEAINALAERNAAG